MTAQRHLAWPPLAIPGGGRLGWSPELAMLERLCLELGERVALVADAQAIDGGPATTVLLMAAPGGPWEGAA
jgi:hypothetical protein